MNRMYPEIEGCNCCRDVKIEKDIGWHCDDCLITYHHYTKAQIEGMYNEMTQRFVKNNRERTREDRQKLGVGVRPINESNS